MIFENEYSASSNQIKWIPPKGLTESPSFTWIITNMTIYAQHSPIRMLLDDVISAKACMDIKILGNPAFGSNHPSWIRL